MGTIQKLFDEQIEAAPRQILTVIVEEKLKNLGRDDPELIGRIVDAVFAGRSRFDAEGSGPALEIKFTPDDQEQVQERIDKFLKGIPELVETITDFSAASLANGCRDAWKRAQPEARAERDAFKKRLERRWGEALDDLRLLLDMCHDVGARFHYDHMKSPSTPGKIRNEALARLHNRSCQVAGEVITLLENGFSEGAKARWRTLLELNVVAILVAEGGDTVAERYLAHEIVDRKKAMEEYQQCAPLLGEPPVPEKSMAAVQKDYEAALCKYGPDFKNSNGWAAGQLGMTNPNPKFSHLQKLAGRIGSRVGYKLASYSVHAGANGFRQQFAMMSADMQIAGATNIGLEQAGAETAHALVLITSLLRDEMSDLDSICEAKAFIGIRDNAVSKFFESARAIERDEKKVQRRAVMATRLRAVSNRHKPDPKRPIGRWRPRQR